MASYALFKLHFTAPLHIAKGKIDYNTAEDMIHSDVLKSALAVCALQLRLITDVKPFLESFKISSAFPFCMPEGKEIEYFFPKPDFTKAETQMHTIAGKLLEDQRKDMKAIKWVGKSLYESLLAGKPQGVAEKHWGGKFLSERLEKIDNKYPEIYTSSVQERVQIPAIVDEDNPTRPYYVDRLYFAKNAGLFFIVSLSDSEDTSTLPTLRKCMRLLADNGLGTDRNVGNGQFEYVETTLELNLPAHTETKYQTNISLFCPANEQELQTVKKAEAYTLLKRGGWISSPENPDHISLRKRSVYMFGEGSIFPHADLVGKVENLKPEYNGFGHDIFRDGTAIFLPIVVKNTENLNTLEHGK